MLAVAACLMFVLNTGLVSLVLSLMQKKPLQKLWTHCYLWTFPYYLVGAALAAVVSISSRFVGWKPSLMVLPLMYLVYSYYRLYVKHQTAHEQLPTA